MLKCEEYNVTIRKAQKRDMVQVFKLIKVQTIGYKMLIKINNFLSNKEQN